jgi:iron complex outermembrane receptor protein
MKYIFKSMIFVFVVLFAGVSNAQDRKSSISGKVVTKDGNPAVNINVFVKQTTHGAQTNENGYFQIHHVTPGKYTVRISGLGVKTIEQAVEIREGQHKLGTFTITESASQLAEVAVKGYKSANQKVTRLTKSIIPSRDLPQSVQIVSTQVIQDQQADRLADVIKNVNGVALGSNRGAVAENFYARGYSLGSNNVFKNGARTSIGGSPEASTLESVEVLKGSAALLYGGVSGGAVVNMVTKKPKFTPGGEVAMRVGSYNQYKPSVDVYGPISDKLAFRAIGTIENAESFRDKVTSKRLYINPSLLYKIDSKSELLVQADYLRSDYTPDFGVGSVNNKIIDYGRDKFLNTPWAYNHTNTGSGQLNYTRQLSSTWDLNAIASIQNYDRNYYGSERLSANAHGVVNRLVNRIRSNEVTYNQQINVSGTVSTGKIKHKILVGMDADQSVVDNKAFNYRNQNGQIVSSYNYGDINLFDPSTYQGNGYMPEAIAKSNTHTPVYRYGVFVQDLISLSKQVKVLAGIRYTDQKNAVATTTTFSNGALAKTATKFDDAFSPKLGLIYQPLPTSSIYLSYANNFIVNTGTDIYLNALAPSTVDQYEAGLKNDFFAGKLSANVTWYRIINNNIAQTAELDVNGNPNSNTSIKSLNGQTTSDGIELDLTGTLLPGLNFMAGYAYNFMRYTKTAPITSHTVPDPTPTDPNHTKTITLAGMMEGVRLVGTTANTANATLFYTVQNSAVKGLKLGVSAFYTGKRNGGWNDSKTATVLRQIPMTPFTTVDFSAGYSWKKMSLLAKVSNIGNALGYYAHENYSINPIPPRQFLTTLSYKF